VKRLEPQFTDLSWQIDGVCSEIDPELFYADGKEPHYQRDAMRACGLCPVRAQCLQWAIDNDEEYGIWGGATPDERVHIASLVAGEPALDVLEAAALVEDDPSLRATHRWTSTSVLHELDLEGDLDDEDLPIAAAA